MNSTHAYQSSKNTRELSIFSFGEFSFDAAKEILYRGTDIVSIPPKTRALLGVFIENAGRILSKEDLMNLVWKDVFVEEANLSHHIAILRKSFGGGATGKKIIQTIPCKGYCFIAEVKINDDEISEIKCSEQALTPSVEETRVESNGFSASADIAEMVAPSAESSRKNSADRKITFFSLQKAIIVLILLLTGTALWAWYRDSFSKDDILADSPEIILKRLTRDVSASSPAVSPDGTSIVFIHGEKGQAAIWRKQIVTGEMTQLSSGYKGNEMRSSLRFAPDGRWIYYKVSYWGANFRRGIVYRIAANGGLPQQIASDVGSDFSISPDGKQIAFGRDSCRLVVVDIESGAERIVAESSGENRILDNTLRSSAAWSPDGSRLVFSQTVFEQNRWIYQLAEINLKTGEQISIPITENSFSVIQLEWLPDGSGLLATRQENFNLSTQIWYIAYPSGTARRISSEDNDFNQIRFSADGKTLVASQIFTNENLWIAPLDNLDRKRQITSGILGRHGVMGAAFARNGEIIYTSTESGALDIWTMNESGDDRRQLTVNAGKENYYPRMTSDGRYIVFGSSRSGTGQIWRMDADGRNPVQLSRGVENWAFGISPENEIYYTGNSEEGKKNQFYKVSVEGGEPVEINDFYLRSSPSFSPDGKWMIFYGGKNESDEMRNVLVERATGKIVRFFDKPFALRSIWLPDSKSIIHTESTGLWRQPIDGGKPQLLADFSPGSINSLNISADGKNIVFSLNNWSNEIVLIENFR